MRLLSTREAVENAIRVLLHSGQTTSSKKWQAIESSKVTAGQNYIGDFMMLEVCDLFFKMKMIEDRNTLADIVGADLPWAEAHFRERITGPSNPGEQYKLWPYWVVGPEFMHGQKFSHTYQERFWPSGEGIRYSPGNWHDVKERLCAETTTRQAFLSIWHPEDQSNNGVRVPCTIGYWFKVSNGYLDITYLIRSCDVRRHFRNDIYMTQRLAHKMLNYLNTQGHNISLGNMSMWIGSLHCFAQDIYELQKQIK